MLNKKLLSSLLLGGVALGLATTSNSAFAAESLTINLSEIAEGKTTTITGNYSGNNAAFERIEIDGVKQDLVSYQGLKEGKISYYVGSKLKTGNKVDVVLYDASYNEIGRQSVQVKENLDPLVINLDSYEAGTTITGNYSGNNAAFERIEIDGVKQDLVSYQGLKEGKISYYVGSKLKTGNKVDVVLYDASYNEIGRQSMKVTKTQTFDLYGQGNQKMATITVKDNKATMQGAPDLKAGLQNMVNPNFGSQEYFKITFLNEQGEDVGHYTWSGNRAIANKLQFTREIPDGWSMKIYHAEAKTRFKTSDDQSLKTSTSNQKEFIYKMENGSLVLSK